METNTREPCTTSAPRDILTLVSQPVGKREGAIHVARHLVNESLVFEVFDYRTGETVDIKRYEWQARMMCTFNKSLDYDAFGFYAEGAY